MTVSFRFNPGWDGPIRRAAERAIEDAAEAVGEDIDRITPIEESTLIRSRKVRMDKSSLYAANSWDAPYAVRQHEDQRLRHDAGRTAKFATKGLQSNAKRVVSFVGDAIRRAL